MPSLKHNGTNDVRQEVSAALLEFARMRCESCGTGILTRSGEYDPRTRKYDHDEIADAIRDGCAHAGDREVTKDHLLPRACWSMRMQEQGAKDCTRHTVNACIRGLNCPSNRVILCKGCNLAKGERLGARRALGEEFAARMARIAEDRLAFVERERVKWIDPLKSQRRCIDRYLVIRALRADFGYPPCIDCAEEKAERDANAQR